MDTKIQYLSYQRVRDFLDIIGWGLLILIAMSFLVVNFHFIDRLRIGLNVYKPMFAVCAVCAVCDLNTAGADLISLTRKNNEDFKNQAYSFYQLHDIQISTNSHKSTRQAKATMKTLPINNFRFQLKLGLDNYITSHLNYVETTEVITPNSSVGSGFLNQRTQLHGRGQLQPVQNKKLNLSLLTTFPDIPLIFSTNLFYHHIFNQIVKENGEFGTSLAQRGQIERYGLSFGTQIRITENWQVLSELKFEESSIIQDNDRMLVGNRPQKSPWLILEINNEYNTPSIRGLSLYLKTNFTSESFKDDAQSQTINPRTYWGLGFSYQKKWLENILTIELRLDELLDIEYGLPKSKLRAAPFIDRPVNKLIFTATYVF